MLGSFLDNLWYLGMSNSETLLEAAKVGDIKTVKEQITLGTNIEVEDKPGPGRDKSRPLHYAARFGHVKIVEFLLDHGALPDVPNDANYWTPLHLAAQGEYLDIVELLLSKGATIDPLDWAGATPLQFAASNRHEKIVELLIKRGAEPKFLRESMFGKHNLEMAEYVENIVSKCEKSLPKKEDKQKLSGKKEMPPYEIVSKDKFLKRFEEKTHLTISPESIDVFKGWQYAEQLSLALAENKKVTHVTLNDCNINDKGIISLGKLLEQNQTITHLFLRRNNITSTGLIQFSESLKKNTSLVLLDLNYNCIFDSGAEALAQAIQKHPKLIHINLSSNPIDEKGALAIIHAVQIRKIKDGTINLSDLSLTNM